MVGSLLSPLIFARNAIRMKAPGIDLTLDSRAALDSLQVSLSPVNVSVAGVPGPAGLAQPPGVDQGETDGGHLLSSP